MSTTPKASEFAEHEIRVFSRLREAGFRPNVIFDVGASNGVWSALVSEVFPDATFHLFEPLAEARSDYQESLQHQMQGHQRFSLHNIALGAGETKIEMWMHADGYSSTILDMQGHPDFKQRVEVNQHTLDGYVSNNGLALPDLIKIDTQGAEHVILSHAVECVRHAKVIFAETWLTRGYGPDTPLITELMELLSASGFVLAEIGHRFYDGQHSLYGCDGFFLKKEFLESLTGSMPRESW